MNYEKLAILTPALFCAFAAAQGQQVDACTELRRLQISGAEITNTELIASGKTIAQRIRALPPSDLFLQCGMGCRSPRGLPGWARLLRSNPRPNTQQVGSSQIGTKFTHFG